MVIYHALRKRYGVKNKMSSKIIYITLRTTSYSFFNIVCPGVSELTMVNVHKNISNKIRNCIAK